jgi:hypothetical protein
MAVLVCPHCEYVNPNRATFCQRCGKGLDDTATLPLLKKAGWQGRDDERLVHTVTFLTEEESFTISLQPDERLILGRQAPYMIQSLDLDLGRFNGAEQGISRIHAVIECTAEGIQLSDLGSRNGTFVNRERLAPFNPQLLQDGDNIAFGHLMMTVRIQINPAPKPSDAATKPLTRTGKFKIGIVRV